MAPRRRSKRNAALSDVDAEGEIDSSSQVDHHSRPSSPTALRFSITSHLEDVNIDALMEILPEVSLENPTPEAIAACYKTLLEYHDAAVNSREEIDQLSSDLEKATLERDQALQDSESLKTELEATAESTQAELRQVKQEKTELIVSVSKLETQLSELGRNQSSSSHEVESLKRKLEETERDKRELLGVISRLEEESSSREEEIERTRELLKTTRREYTELETTLREVRATETSTSFKVETLTQQLQLAKDENTRVNAELASKAEEFSKYRREKHAEIVQLQSNVESLTQSNSQTTLTLRSLQTSHTSQSHHLSQALQKVQDLTGQLADQEAKYSSEAANLRRLVQMMEERETQTKELVAGIERDWEGLGATATAREQKLRDELEEEIQKNEALEKQMEDMKIVMDRINRGEFPIPDSMAQTQSVSRRSSGIGVGHVSFSGDEMAGLSPGLAMINRMQKSGKTFTEVYADYVRLQDELSKKTAENVRLDRTLTEVLAEIEERAPLLNQQRRDLERVQSESLQLASQLAQAIADRDGNAAHIQELSQRFQKSERENALLQQHLEDLGRQVQTLLRDIARRDDPSIPLDEEVDATPAENVDSLITNNLVLFKSIPALQEQNQKLLQITRELGMRMELEEKEYKEALDREQAEALHEAHEAIQALQAQLENQQRSHQNTIQAYAKERDTLKTMLSRVQRDGSAPQVNGHGPGRAGDAELVQTSGKQDLNDEQSMFEAYRHEMGVDAVKLREEVMSYQREVGQLGAALAKANAKIDFLNERHKLSQEQYTVQSREFDSLKKRYQQLHDQHTRLDIACNHATEKLHDANAQIERLRNDCANLKAEKHITESTQNRLLEENKSISLERSRLSDLIGNVQRMHNEIERTNESDKRRFETQIQSLEAQTQELRGQLGRERDALRHASLQKEIEERELRTKIEKTSEDLSKAREALAVAETDRKHLLERVNDLSKQVQTTEEKLAVYERRTVPASSSGGLASAADGEDAQQLRAELAELRGALKAAEVDLLTAKGHVTQFQEISQASEAALAALSATHDEYKAATEAQIATLEAQHKSDEEKLAAIQQEIATLNAKNTELLREMEKERAAFAADKKTLEDTIVDITNAEANSRTDQASRDLEVREQAERAKAAEEKYSREVVAHADSLKVVDGLKQEINVLRTQVREHGTAAETAQAKLASSELSWAQQREALDKELGDLQKRCKDLADQNAVLHQHLESVSSQASKIRSAASTTADGTATEQEAGDSDGRIAELRSVVAYLRKEKEIIDLQLELSKQETARYKAQIAHLSQTLEETRNTLSAEREQTATAMESSTDHAELIERINQLNILRESNATLRAESEANARRAKQLESQVSNLVAELEPAKEEARVSRAQLEEKEKRVSRLEEENRQWKERNSQLLTKYDRIDPSDVQALRDEIDDLQIDARKFDETKANLEKELEEQKKLSADTTAALNDFKTKYQELMNQSRTRIGQLNTQMTRLKETVSQLNQQVKDLTAEKERLAAQGSADGAKTAEDNAALEQLKATVETLTREKAEAEKVLAEQIQKSDKLIAENKTALAALQEERDKLLAEKASWASSGTAPVATQDGSDTEALKQQFDTERSELQKARDEALAQVKAAEERATKVSEELQGIKFQNEKFQSRIVDNEKRRAAESQRIAQLTAKHKQEQEHAVAAATEKLRTELQTPGADAAQVAAKHAEELKALEARLVAKHEAEMKAALEKLRSELSKATTQTGQNGKAAITTEEHEQALKAATDRGRMEATTKLRLKDSMLAKAQNNVKQLEAQIKAWREAGIIPAADSSANAAASGSGTTAQVPPVVPHPRTGAPAASTSTAGQAAGAPNALPRKPAGIVPAPVGGPGGRTVRSNPRAPAGRGGAPGGRGGAPVQAAAAAAATAASANAAQGVSIMGAAGKRSREEGEIPASDSLAKRLKPVEVTGKPVPFRRDRIAPTPPQPPPAT